MSRKLYVTVRSEEVIRLIELLQELYQFKSKVEVVEWCVRREARRLGLLR